MLKEQEMQDLFEGTIQPGGSIKFSSTFCLWIRIQGPILNQWMGIDWGELSQFAMDLTSPLFMFCSVMCLWSPIATTRLINLFLTFKQMQVTDINLI